MGSLERELRRRQIRTIKRLSSPGPKSERQKEVERASAMKARELRAWREAETRAAQERQGIRRRILGGGK